MLLNHAAVERLAETIKGLEGRDGKPLAGRLHHLRTLKFPSERTKGRGSKTSMSVEDGLKVLYAIEMMDAGIPPAQAVAILRSHWDLVSRLIAHAWARRTAPAKGRRAERRHLIIAPAVLARDTEGENGANELVGALTTAELGDALESGHKHVLVLDVEGFAARLAQSIEPARAGTAKELEEEMKLLATEAFQTRNQELWRLDDNTGDAKKSERAKQAAS